MKKVTDKNREQWARFLMRFAMELRKNHKNKSIVVNGQYRLVA